MKTRIPLTAEARLSRQAELGQLDSVRVADCQDAVIYLLAAMSHVAVVGCTDCIVVVGAVSGCLKVCAEETNVTPRNSGRRLCTE